MPFPRVASPRSPTPPGPHFESLEVIERIKTELQAPNAAPYFMYSRVPWQLHIRKEVRTLLKIYVITLKNELLPIPCLDDCFKDPALDWTDSC
jgi:hypothetical protein